MFAGGLLAQGEDVDILILSRARVDEGNGVFTNAPPSHLPTVGKYRRDGETWAGGGTASKLDLLVCRETTVWDYSRINNHSYQTAI